MRLIRHKLDIKKSVGGLGFVERKHRVILYIRDATITE